MPSLDNTHIDAGVGNLVGQESCTACTYPGRGIPLVHHSRDLMREVSIGIVTRIRVADADYAAMWPETKAVRDSREPIC